MILTDEEKLTLVSQFNSNILLDLIDSVEAAILAKIGEPVAWRGIHGWMHTGVKICPTDTPLYRIPEVKE